MNALLASIDWPSWFQGFSIGGIACLLFGWHLGHAVGRAEKGMRPQ